MTKPDFFPIHFAEPDVEMAYRADGGAELRSRLPLREGPAHLGEWLRMGALAHPKRLFLSERRNGMWQGVSWHDAHERARRLAQGLIERGLGPDRGVMVWSDNSVAHGLLMLGCHLAGVPISPVSPAYALKSRDCAKLVGVMDLVEPGLLFVEERAPFLVALSLVQPNCDVVTAQDLPDLQSEPDARLEARIAGLDPDTVAKILFTSGSTGVPKGVINTHRMLVSNQEMIATVWPFLAETPPTLVDWLPWNHTFGGNHNFNMVLRNGGTLYIDPGKPVPELVHLTVESLMTARPTVYFNVPSGFRALLPHLEADPALRARFFDRLQLIFYAGAALSQDLWDRLEDVSVLALGKRVVMTSAWGATETSPLATTVHYPIDRAGVIGVPAPGVSLKLAPVAGRFEMRLKGPNITPGYLHQPEITAAAFDDEGWFRTGDAGKLIDPNNPNAGVVFDGRVAEDFKLSTGTWVHVGNLRPQVIAACSPWVSDLVMTGHDGETIGALLWLSPEGHERYQLAPDFIKSSLYDCLFAHNAANPTSSTRIGRVLILTEPPDVDAGEITDKGYVNQRVARDRRAADVTRLHEDVPDAGIISI